MDTITGTIVHITFAREEDGFTVAKLQERDKTSSTVIVGILPAIRPGESLVCEGSWRKHPKYGEQFFVDSFEPCIPCDLVGIQRYLESGMIRGIGPTYAKKIIKKFGLATLEIIDKEPERLLEIEGIGGKRYGQILSCWQEQQSVRRVMVFLRGHEVSSSYAHKIYKAYGEESIQKVQDDPFALTREFFGIGFKTADKIALSLGIAKDSARRLDAGISHLFRNLASEGHTCFPLEEFYQRAGTLLEVAEALIQERVQELVKDQTLVEEDGKIWTGIYYATERIIAQELNGLLKHASNLRSVDTKRALAWVQTKLGITLAVEQSTAVEQSLTQKVMIITGGPGTGKSTITKAILRIYEKLTDKILLAAPTGRAAKRLGEITHKKAFTIHALLEMDFLSKKFQKNQDNTLAADVLIIDESSMIDTYLLYHLLRAIPSHCRVIFIGDVDQLPSVGAGKVLKDLITSSIIPTFFLKRIFRQAQHSRIVTNAHRINQGFLPDLQPFPGSDFLFTSKEAPEEILEELLSQVQLLGRSFPNRFQVLSPMKKGILGTENLNLVLQKLLNPQGEALTRMGRSFRVDDKVMQIKNNYQKKVYNGDIGKVARIDHTEEQLEVRFDDQLCLYTFYELDELVLAYAVSIHKYQGSEADCIILPIHTGHFKLLNKNLLYTGVTRGKKLVHLIGSTKAVAIAVKNKESQERHTGLQKQLQLRDPAPLLRDYISQATFGEHRKP